MEPLSLLASSHPDPASSRWAVIDKPSGLCVHRTRGATGPFALQRIRDQLGRHVHLVHRLDRGTSGCLLIAFDPATTRELQAAMARPTSRKRYLALCRGPWMRSAQPLVVERPLTDARGRSRAASTALRCLGSAPGCRAALLLAEPHSGRHHQVRRHCSGVDHPVLGDSAHGDTRVNRRFRTEHGLRRLALHCAELDLDLGGGDRLQARASLPAELADLLRRMSFCTPELLRTLDLEPEDG